VDIGQFFGLQNGTDDVGGENIAVTQQTGQINVKPCTNRTQRVGAEIVESDMSRCLVFAHRDNQHTYAPIAQII